MGILSNTCSTHWEYCLGRYRIVAEGFDVYALSYRLGAVEAGSGHLPRRGRPGRRGAGRDIFVDDMAEHVAGARAAGFDAVQFTTAAALAADFVAAAIRCNY